MVVVAFLTASAVCVVTTIITATFSRTISAANSWNDEVSSLHVAEFLEAIEQCVIKFLVPELSKLSARHDAQLRKAIRTDAS